MHTYIHTNRAVTCVYMRMYTDTHLDIVIVGDDSFTPLDEPHGQQWYVKTHPLQVDCLVKQLEH